MKDSKAMKPEKRYVFKQLVKFVGEKTPRYVTPWSNPRVHEYAFDYVFKTQKEALDLKRELAPDEDWVLCLETITPIRKVST